MNAQILIGHLKKLMELPGDQLQAGDKLDGFSTWDSLTKVSLIAVIEREYQVVMTGEELEKCQSIQDILLCIQEKYGITHHRTQ